MKNADRHFHTCGFINSPENPIDAPGRETITKIWQNDEFAGVI
jgi:hypothetical protein